jgi:hypothetical protein
MLTARATDDQGATVDSTPAEIIVRHPLPDLSFQLAFHDVDNGGQVFFRDYTLNGPTHGHRLLPTDRVVPDAGGRYYYGAKPHRVWRVDSQTGDVVDLDPDGELPPVSWPMGVASVGDYIALITLGGEGHLYFYYPTYGGWSDPDTLSSLNNVDFDCLEHYSDEDFFLALTTSSEGEGPWLYHIWPNGEMNPEFQLPPLPFRIGPGAYRAELVSLGYYVVLLLEPEPGATIANAESRMYLIDLAIPEAQLIYRQPLNRAPIVNFYSPPDGATFTAPADIGLTAFAQDLEDGINVTVEFFAGTNSLGFGAFVPSLCPPPFCPYFTLVWSNAPPGSHMLRAKVTDTAGRFTVSPPIQISVAPSNQLPPVVTIHATDPNASETGVLTIIDTGTFTITRTGGTDLPLEVHYRIGGTASNSVDYLAISNRVTLPAGSSFTRLHIRPIYDTLDEGIETVVLHLQEPICAAIFPPPPGCYRVGSPGEATVYIADFATPPTNDLPVVTLSVPDPIAAEGTNCWCRFTASHEEEHLHRTNNPARFLISRTGPIEAALTVNYSIGGTASNGMDYATLSGEATVPAGHRSVPVLIIPIDDQLTEGIETVKLRINASPDIYLVGSP